MMASLALSPDKAARAGFKAGPGTGGLIGRDFAFANGLVMRHVYDRLVISPPLILTTEDIDTLAARVLVEEHKLYPEVIRQLCS